MTDETTEILDPDQPVTLSTKKDVLVREMNWKAMKRFLDKLTARSAEFLMIDAKGAVDLNTQRLIQVIVSDLGEALITATTELDQEAIDNLPVSDFALLLDRAVALNLRPSMLAAGKAVAGRFKSLMGKN